MKKNLTTLALCSFAFGLGFGMNNVTFGNATPAPAVKIAHVNTQKLLASSKNLKAAEKDKAKKTTEMLKWYDSIDSQIKAKTKEDISKIGEDINYSQIDRTAQNQLNIDKNLVKENKYTDD